jgi:hypothetical protein
MNQIEIKKLGPSLLGDFLEFFDRHAFADNPHWASCYCFFNHARHATEDWATRKAEQNREAVVKLIASGRMHGHLAYVRGQPVGWCNANTRDRYTTLADEPAFELVGSVVCFV